MLVVHNENPSSKTKDTICVIALTYTTIPSLYVERVCIIKDGSKWIRECRTDGRHMSEARHVFSQPSKCVPEQGVP